MHFIKSLFLFLCCLGISFNLSAQSLEYAQGQILVKTFKETDLKQTVKDLKRLDGKKTNLKVNKTVVAKMNIYLLDFDYTTIHEGEMLQALARHKGVETAQFNHFINERLIPNDPEFDNQWQYINTGQDGGTAGADIDIELAWDITTGGVTANGDTIVVAALDNGINLNHEDFEDNLWRNWAEIPNNGIDDDNNGYIDDYRGYNSTDGSDDISGGSHGTPVAGIMGAKGNNGVGVSGISWDVKVMIIRNDFQTSEAEVLNAYGYALTQRQMYNESNGEEGAFVVATNASWGINNGQPEDAPLWCSFYDTLGVQGILNCGATANADYNIDETGDLPTACPSDFMISVTNMNRNDVKVTGAGYGATTIDLGAFGQETWTTNNFGGYAGFGGTSGATPHVTGTVGLLYSAPCSAIANLALSNPEAAALAVRQYILEGVDPNESLIGITTTGGRLNVRNSLDILMNACGPCPAPSYLQNTNTTDVMATITWINPDSTLSNNLRYRLAGTEDWTMLENVSSPYTFTETTACTAYEIQVYGICQSDTSMWSNSLIFTTDGCCEAPNEVTFTNVQETQFDINYNSILAANSYVIRYRQQGAADWITVTDVTETTLTIESTESCITYEVQVATFCNDTLTNYTNIATVTTPGCGACEDQDYCDRPNGDATYEWLNKVTINGTVYESGNNNGDASFVGSPTTIDAAAEDLTLTMEPGFQGTVYSEVYNVWIDLNQDGVFSPFEKLFTSENTSEPVTANISIPLAATNGITRMRIIMSWNAATEDPCYNQSFYGETEDYCVNIINAGQVLDCTAPANFMATNISETSVSLSWDASDAALSYNVIATPTSGGSSITNFISTDSLTVNGLDACTEYLFAITANCLNGQSDAAQSTITTTCVEPCDEVTGLEVTEVGADFATLSWDNVDTAIEYNITVGFASGVTNVVANENPYTLMDLTPQTEYNISITAICADTLSTPSPAVHFTTTIDNAINTLPSDTDKLNVFPNPFKHTLRLDWTLNNATKLFNIDIYNANGQLVSSQQREQLNTGNHSLTIDTKAQAAGIYFVQITTDAGSTMRRVVKL